MRSRSATAIVGVMFVMIGLAVASPALAQTTTTAPAFDVKIDGDYGWHLPPDVSEHGHGVDLLINTLHLFMIALFVAWGIFMLHCLVKFRQRPGHKANADPIKAKASKYAEVGVAVFEAFLLIGLSMPVWASVKNEIPMDDPDAIHIRVVAEQFQWNFHYPGADGVFGRTAPEHIDAVNPVGIDPSDPNGADDVQSPELHFPKEKPVVCYVTSKDVIHSFALPVMRVKQDVIPGMRIPIGFKATQAGNYEVACAQLCGNNHYSMRALMAIHETEEEFVAWLDTQKVEDFDEDDFD